ncbi:MAG: Abi family protein [Flavobacteriales bacterium]|nr:Abi family protein [Flavobacteriales bacterium]
MQYNKLPLTYQDQIALMSSRGLIIHDLQRAERYLQEISYYRLSAYALPYQQQKDSFNANTTFDNILDLYLFDRELRLIIFDAIERIEVAIRAQIIYQLAHKYGSHWQDDVTIFKPPFTHPHGFIVDVFQDTQKLIVEHCNAKHQEVFIKHYTTKYSGPTNPPAWMSIELLTVGQLSRLYTALKSNADKQDIAGFFGLHHTVFTSWLHSITYIRNICAHHSRLWNRELAIKPELLLKPRKPWLNANYTNNNDRCFYLLSTLKYMLHSANPSNHLKHQTGCYFKNIQRFRFNFGNRVTIPGNMIDWQNEPIWQN